MAIETLGAALRQIKRLFAEGVIAGLSDAQLLERFLAQGDAGAFEALMGRHGPMVLDVCRAVVRDPRDAEDAFQATFLVLVKKGGTIRGRDALGGWLYQVAHRAAIQANTAAARRRKLERQVGQMAVATSTNGPAAWDDLCRRCTRWSMTSRSPARSSIWKGIRFPARPFRCWTSARRPGKTLVPGSKPPRPRKG